MRLNPGKHPWDRGRPARPGRWPAMDDPPQAHDGSSGRDARDPGNTGAVCVARFAAPMCDFAGNSMGTRGTKP